MADVIVTDNPDASRYEAHLDDELAGFAEYERTDVDIVFIHTKVDPAFEGKGVGSALARGALDDVRRQGELDVITQCDFIEGWIEKHPDYYDLLGLDDADIED